MGEDGGGTILFKTKFIESFYGRNFWPRLKVEICACEIKAALYTELRTVKSYCMKFYTVFIRQLFTVILGA